MLSFKNSKHTGSSIKYLEFKFQNTKRDVHISYFFFFLLFFDFKVILALGFIFGQRKFSMFFFLFVQGCHWLQKMLVKEYLKLLINKYDIDDFARNRKDIIDRNDDGDRNEDSNGDGKEM